MAVVMGMRFMVMVVTMSVRFVIMVISVMDFVIMVLAMGRFFIWVLLTRLARIRFICRSLWKSPFQEGGQKLQLQSQ
jgi:hypothetical protein